MYVKVGLQSNIQQNKGKYSMKHAINHSLFELTSIQESPANQNIDEQLNELFYLQSQLKKLDYYKSILATSLKEHMKEKCLQSLENVNGKVNLVSMNQNRLDKSLLSELGVSDEVIELSHKETVVEQFRISLR